MGFASNMAKTAKRLINKYGSNIVLVKMSNCDYDPTTGDSVYTKELYPFYASISSYTVQESASPTVTQGDLSCLIQTDLIITKNDNIEYNMKSWEIIDITRTVVQDLTIAQRLQIRAVSD